MRTGRYYSWFSLFYAMATGVGLLSRVLISDPSDFDPELALPVLAQPALGVGLSSRGLCATLSLFLVLAALALTRFVGWSVRGPRWWCWLPGLGIGRACLSVFLVGWRAWGRWGTGALGVGSVCMGGLGVAVAVGWRLLGWHTGVYEGMPAILAGLLGGWIVRPRRRQSRIPALD
ncbi:MAG: hypothetical protein IPN63_10020 [Gammaproteobacteria bacterium]|nr:hypothetical protein [Gammaproteobacteria bacterium]